MKELLQLDNQAAAERIAAQVSAGLTKILQNDDLSLEASLYGSQLSDIIG